MRHNKFLVTATLSVLLLSALPAFARSAAELLEKGIYLEETAGRIDQAIEIYRQIATDATADRAHVAEALLRLGVCHLKQGDAAAASRALERILVGYPEQEQLVAQAREHLSAAGPDPIELLAAPWVDGEVMRMTLALASGTPLGGLLLTADATELDGEELWRLRVRRKIFSDTDNQAISQVLARRNTMAPVESVLKHSVGGHLVAKYGDAAVSIDDIGSGTQREEKIDSRTFDSEELFHLLRRLPLEVGYKRTIRLLSTPAGDAKPVDIEVTGKETVTVPAGELECYRVKLSLPQVFWISTDPSRVLVKLEASGIVGELAEVYRQEPGRETVYRHQELGFSVSLPPDWLFLTFDSHAAEVLFLLDPDAQAQTRMEIRRAGGDGSNCFFQAAAHRKLEQARAALHDYALRDGTWSERDLAGWPAVSFAGDYREVDRRKVHYWTFIENDSFCVDFTLKVPADRFEALRAAFDTIIESYQGKAPPVAQVPASEAVRAVQSVIADFHLAADDDDAERAFEHLARDAIFFGPDAADRLDVERLRERFSEAALWMAEPSDRHVAVSDDETLAWFDQRLASRNLGELRASGVLRFVGGRWKIVQYHVAMPVPNELVAELVEKLRVHDQEVGRQPVDVAPPTGDSADDPAQDARRLLRDVHLAKAEADGARYFGHFARRAVVLGTARSERLTVAGLRALVGPYYARGVGPTSIPIAQRLYLSPQGNMAWFEELLERKHLGRMRGTGVIAEIEGSWKLVHYNTVIVVPTELAEELARRIDTFYAPASARAEGEGELSSTVWRGLITRRNTYVNEFSSLTSDAEAGSQVLSVDDARLNAHRRFSDDLSEGDLILIIQMQGAIIDGEPGDRTWGRVLSYGNCGNWELRTVARVAGSRAIELKTPLQHSYRAGGKVQIVRVPRYPAMVVNTGASLTTEKWNGTTGGILAISVDTDLIVEENATIDVSGSGFRGGEIHRGSNMPQRTNRLKSRMPADGGEKGESIAGYKGEYSRFGGMYCYGAPANGGGGGNSHNAAGGGGANAGHIDDWTGNGNPDLSNLEWDKAWNLEFEGFSKARSSGGGRGGYTWSNTNANALEHAPGARIWAGDGRRPVGGLGGRPLDYSSGKLFLGGGGGAGEANGPNGTPGGGGGGLIVIKAKGAIKGEGLIIANGSNVRPTATIGKTAADGPGGGGAGGTIVIDAKEISGVTITANGGQGGDQRIENRANSGFYYEAEGGGGGGGGGYISISGRMKNVETEVKGGKNGGTDSPSLTEFPPNGATAGGSGIISPPPTPTLSAP